jgi:dienelactone hydrolase
MSDIRTREITCHYGGVEMKGSSAWDAGLQGPRPVVLVVHEWWGCDDYARRRAAMLAQLGYTGVAVDLYGGGRTAANPEEAGELMNGLLGDREALRGRFNAALEAARSLDVVDPRRAAAIGYCMGGGVVLHMARTGADLAAVASFHGALPLAVAEEGEGAEVTARMAVYHGEADEFITPDDVGGFLEEIEKARADCLFVLMPGCTHGFTNPEASVRSKKYGLPLRYDEAADRSSWDHMQLVLREAFA